MHARTSEGGGAWLGHTKADDERGCRPAAIRQVKATKIVRIANRVSLRYPWLPALSAFFLGSRRLLQPLRNFPLVSIHSRMILPRSSARTGIVLRTLRAECGAGPRDQRVSG